MEKRTGKFTLFHTDRMLNKFRLCHSEAIQHTYINVKRTTCVLCCRKKIQKQTNFQCKVCSVPLCRSGNPSCYQIWHHESNLLLGKQQQLINNLEERYITKKLEKENSNNKDNDTTSSGPRRSDRIQGKDTKL